MPQVDILGFLDQVTQTLTSLITDLPWTYLLILGLVALDVVLPIIPSEASVLIASVLAGTGHLNIVLIMIAAALGAFIGDNVAYWIGRTAGRPLIERVLGGRMDRLTWVEAHLERARRFADRDRTIYPRRAERGGNRRGGRCICPGPDLRHGTRLRR